LVILLVRLLKISLVFNLCANTPNAITWLNGPAISKEERHFSSPLQAFRKLAKWLDGLSGTTGKEDAMSFALSTGIISSADP
jgi:hypothetical protein